MTGRLLSTAEVAAMYRVCPRTVRRWARAGRIIPVALNSGRTRGAGGYRYAEGDVAALLANGTRLRGTS